MHHRGFRFGRLIMFLLIIGGLIAMGRGRYRAGFEDGFVRGMAFAAVDGGSGEASPDSAAVPPAWFAPWGRGWGHGGLGPVEGGVSLGFGLLGFAFIAFMAMLVMGAMGRRCGAHYGPPGAWGHPGHPGHPGHRGHRDHGRPNPSDEIGPEKQPEDYV